jgi:hypothetical protein
MGTQLSTRNTVPATEKLLNEAGMRADFRALTVRALHEALDIYRHVLGAPVRLDLAQFDQVFGIMLGDAEPHFALLSGEATGTQPAGPLMCDARMVFLTLTLLVPHADTASSATFGGGQAARLAQLAFIFELVTGENAADTGLTERQLAECMSKACAGICRLLGSKVPDASVFRATAEQLIHDADERTCVALVKRRHLNSFLEADLMIKKFLHAASERIVGSDLDNASVAGAYLNGDLLGDSDDEMPTALELEAEMNKSGGVLVARRLRSLARSSWFVAQRKRNCVDVRTPCGAIVRSLHDSGAGRAGLCGHTLPLIEEEKVPDKAELLDSMMGGASSAEEGEGRATATASAAAAAAELIDSMGGASSDKEGEGRAAATASAAAAAAERVSCGIASCVGFVDPHHLLNSFMAALMDAAGDVLLEHQHHQHHSNDAADAPPSAGAGGENAAENTALSVADSNKKSDKKPTKQKQKKKSYQKKKKHKSAEKLTKFVTSVGKQWSARPWCQENEPDSMNTSPPPPLLQTLRADHPLPLTRAVDKEEVVADSAAAAAMLPPTTPSSSTSAMPTYHPPSRPPPRPDPPIHMLLEQPLIHAMDALGREGQRAVMLCHALDAVGRRNVTHVLSEWDLLEALIEHDQEWLNGCVHATVEELGFCKGERGRDSSLIVTGTGDMVTINHAATALDGFLAVLACEHQRAVAVVDDAGTIVASLGAADFVMLLEQDRGADGVGNFAQLMVPIRKCTLLPVHSQVCRPDTVLTEVMDQMLTGRIRNVFVCDEDLRPIGAMSVPDVLGLCATVNEVEAFRFVESKKKGEAGEGGEKE